MLYIRVIKISLIKYTVLYVNGNFFYEYITVCAYICSIVFAGNLIQTKAFDKYTAANHIL